VKVIGIDPGTASCGYGIVHERDGRLRAIDHGWWKTAASERPEARLKTIFDAVAELVEVHHPDAVAIEESFVGADARTALSVGQLARESSALSIRRPASSRWSAATGAPRSSRCRKW